MTIREQQDLDLTNLRTLNVARVKLIENPRNFELMLKVLEACSNKGQLPYKVEDVSSETYAYWGRASSPTARSRVVREDRQNLIAEMLVASQGIENLIDDIAECATKGAINAFQCKNNDSARGFLGIASTALKLKNSGGSAEQAFKFENSDLPGGRPRLNRRSRLLRALSLDGVERVVILGAGYSGQSSSYAYEWEGRGHGPFKADLGRGRKYVAELFTSDADLYELCQRSKATRVQMTNVLKGLNESSVEIVGIRNKHVDDTELFINLSQRSGVSMNVLSAEDFQADEEPEDLSFSCNFTFYPREHSCKAQSCGEVALS